MATSAMFPCTSTSTSTCVPMQLTTSQLRYTHLKPLCALWLRKAQILRCDPCSCKILMRECIVRAQEADSSAAEASTNSVVAQVAMLEEAESTLGVESKASTTNTKGRRSSPLTRGGTLTGDKAAGKDPGLTALGKAPVGVELMNGGTFKDARWKAGSWDLQQFTAPNGKVNWDAVIDAEVRRRKWLEDNPEACLNEDPVVFEASTIPWWAWMRRFHLPEAELLNGRAAMIGFSVGYVVDGLTGMGLVDQTSSLVGKLLLFVSVFGVLCIRKNEDVENLKQLAQEWNFYDKQWQASWQDEQAPSLKAKD